MGSMVDLSVQNSQMVRARRNRVNHNDVIVNNVKCGTSNAMTRMLHLLLS